jgi:hypothetical protein
MCVTSAHDRQLTIEMFLPVGEQPAAERARAHSEMSALVTSIATICKMEATVDACEWRNDKAVAPCSQVVP